MSHGAIGNNVTLHVAEEYVYGRGYVTNLNMADFLVTAKLRSTTHVTPIRAQVYIRLYLFNSFFVFSILTPPIAISTHIP